MYKINPIPSDKDKIKQPQCVLDGILPKVGSSMCMVGSSGSGKSILVYNLLENKRFYGGKQSFDQIFLFSPTALTDSIQKALKVPESNCITDIKQDGEKAINMILESQKRIVEKRGTDKAPSVLIYFDDCIGCTKLMQTEAFTKTFIANRHFAITTILCSQHFTRLPKVCRLQCSAFFLFALSRSECEMITDYMSPPMMTKKQMLFMLNDNLKEKYSFICIFKHEPWETRFRSCLGEIINLDHYRKIK